MSPMPMTKSRSRVSVRWLMWPTAAARPGNSALGLGSASPRMAKRSTGSAAWVSAGVRVLAASSRVGSRVRRFMMVPWSGGGWCLVWGAHRVRSRPVIFDVPGVSRSGSTGCAGYNPGLPRWNSALQGLVGTSTSSSALSAADHSAVLMGDDQRGGAGAAVAVAGGVAEFGVLNVDPQGAVVRSPGDAGDFCASWADQKTADFPALRVGAEQLVTAGVDRVCGFLVGVGLDPQPPGTVESQPVRGGEDIAADITDQVIWQRLTLGVQRSGLVTGEQEYVPLEGSGSRVGVGLTPAHYLPVLIVGSGVGRVQREAFAALAVVGQGDVDLAAVGVHRDPFRAIHGRGAEQVGGAPGVEQYRLLIGKAVGGGQTLLAPDQRQPLAAAVLVEAGGVQGAAVQQLATGCRVGRVVAAVGHELPHVLAPGVVAGVEGHAPVLAERHHRALPAETAHGGALDRRAVRVEGVDFHHPAEAVGLVDLALVGLAVIRGGVEALVHRFPGVVGAALAVADAVALVGRAGGVVGGVAVDEVVVEVLFAGQVGAPGGDAHGAVVQGAQHPGAGRITGGAHAPIAAQRAADGHRRHGADAPVVARAGHPLPLAVGTAADLQHADPVGSLLLAHLIDGALAAAIGQVGIAQAVGVQGRVDVLVVDHQQAMVIGCLLEGEEVHAVMVVTGLQQLCLPVLGGVLAPGRGIVQYRIAPAEERLGAVTLGHQHPVEVGRGLRRYSAETQQWPGRWRAAALAAEQAGAEQADGC